MSDFPYRIPTLSDAPKRLFEWGRGSSVVSDSAPELRLGIYCAEESHISQPWFLGSFTPNWPALEELGTLSWTFTNDYPTGDGHLLKVKGATTQLIADKERVPTNFRGTPQMTADAHRQGYGRWSFKCGVCGLSRVFRSDSVQSAVNEFVKVGVRESSLSMFISAVQRFKR